MRKHKERRLERTVMAESTHEQALLSFDGLPSESDCLGSTLSPFSEASAVMDLCIKTEPDDQDISHPEEMESELHLDTEQINTEIVMVKIKEDHADLQLCSTTEDFCCPLNSSTCLLSRQHKSKTGAIKVLQCNHFQGPSSMKLTVNEAACNLLQNTSVKLEDSLIAAGDDVQKKGALKQSVVPVISDTSHKARKQRCHDGVTKKSQKWQCPQCRKVLKSQSQLKIHLQIHSGIKYCCIQCGRSFSQPFRLKQHQLIHCGKQKYSSQGGKTSTGDESKHDQLVHSGEKPYMCSECGKSFSRGDHLKEHQRVHSGEKPYKCSECGKSFSRGYNLKQHKLIHSGEKSFQCAECGKSFSRGGILKRHQLVHSDEKPHKCSECGKSFSRGNQLKQHKLVHSGEKPFKCAQCGKGFFHAGNLKQHQLVHTGEKPYECSQCGKNFSQGGTLKRHQLIHSGEKPYKGRECGKSSALRLY